MMPSWARVIERAIARPRPAPPLWSMRAPDQRRNGSNRPGTASGGTSSPVFDDGQRGLGADPHVDGAARPVVLHGVLHEVGDQAFQQHLLADDHARLELRLVIVMPASAARARWVSSTAVGDEVEPQRGARQQAAVALGEHQQALDEPLVALVGLQQLRGEQGELVVGERCRPCRPR